MLSTIFLILFFLSLALLVWGLVSPKSFSSPKQRITRKDMGWTFGILSLVFFVLVGVTAPEPDNQENLNQVPQETTAAEEEQEIEEEVSAEELAELEKEAQRNYWHKVVRVIDGDTVVAMVDGKEEPVQVAGINAPEAISKTECFGKKATNKAKEFLEGKWIQLETEGSQKNRDKEGSLLRYVWFDEGTDFGRRMIEEGYAYEQHTYTPSHSKQAQYKETQKHAKSNSNGLWSKKTCNGKKQKPTPKPKPQPISTPAPRTETTPQPRPAPQPRTSTGVVKKSTSGICHAPGTTYYDRTTNYTSFNSVQACLNSGGRLPLR